MNHPTDCPIEVLTCDGKNAGWVRPEYEGEARARGYTTKDHRKPEWKSGVLPGGIEWTEDPSVRADAGDIVLKYADRKNALKAMRHAGDGIWHILELMKGGSNGNELFGTPDNLWTVWLIARETSEWRPHGSDGNVLLKTGPRPPHPLPDWVDREKVYEHGGKRWKASEYRVPRTGDTIVQKSGPDYHAQRCAWGPVDEFDHFAGGRIILREVS